METRQRGHNWLWIFLAGVLIVGLTVIGRVSWQRMRDLRVGQRRADQPVGELLASSTVGQSFYNPADGLRQLDLVFGTYGHPGTSDVILHLKTSPDAMRDLAVARLNSQDVENNIYNSFHFPQQRDIAGRTLFFYLEAPDASPGNAVTVYRSDKDVYQKGQAYYNGVAASNDLVFVAHYRLGPLGVARFVLRQLSDQRPCLLGNPLFYVTLIAVHFSLVGKLFVFLREREARVKGEENQRL
jgi:hypothetical protein